MKYRNLVFVIVSSFLLLSAAMVQMTAAGGNDDLIQSVKKEYEALKLLRAAKTDEDAPSVLESEDLNPEICFFPRRYGIA